MVGADPITGAETNWLFVNDNNRARVTSSVHTEAQQAVIDISGIGITAFANVNNTAIGNLPDREGVRIFNRGKTIKWRIFGELTGSDGEEIGKGEALEFEYGENIVIELVEDNNSNEIDVIITEFR